MIDAIIINGKEVSYKTPEQLDKVLSMLTESFMEKKLFGDCNIVSYEVERKEIEGNKYRLHQFELALSNSNSDVWDKAIPPNPPF